MATPGPSAGRAWARAWDLGGGDDALSWEGCAEPGWLFFDSAPLLTRDDALSWEGCAEPGWLFFDSAPLLTRRRGAPLRSCVCNAPRQKPTHAHVHAQPKCVMRPIPVYGRGLPGRVERDANGEGARTERCSSRLPLVANLWSHICGADARGESLPLKNIVCFPIRLAQNVAVTLQPKGRSPVCVRTWTCAPADRSKIVGVNTQTL